MPEIRRTKRNAPSRAAGRSAAQRSGSRPLASRAQGSGGRRPQRSAGRAGGAPARVAAGQRIATSTLVLLGAVVLALVALVPTVNTYVSQQQELSRLESQVTSEQARVEQLERDIARWEDPNFVAAQARERLLFALPGETQYRLTDSSGKDVPLPAAEREQQAAEQSSWFGSLWDSLVASSQASPPEKSAADPSATQPPPSPSE